MSLSWGQFLIYKKKKIWQLHFQNNDEVTNFQPAWGATLKERHGFVSVGRGPPPEAALGKGSRKWPGSGRRSRQGEDATLKSTFWSSSCPPHLLTYLPVEFSTKCVQNMVSLALFPSLSPDPNFDEVTGVRQRTSLLRRPPKAKGFYCH